MSETPIFDKMNQPEQPDLKPQPKVIAATIGGGVGTAIGTIAVWIIEATANIDIPNEVELAIGVVLTAGLAFVGGYFKKN